MTHSRSSSELDAVQYKDILPIFIEDFMKDFEFADVKDTVKSLFTTDEYTAIAEEKNLKKQIIRLFWILCSDERLIEKFLTAIRYEYYWLHSKISNETRLSQSKITEQYIEFVKHLRSNDQKHTDYNVHRMEPYYALRNALKRLKRNHFVILSGELGTGKKWLTQDVCCDFSVFKSMNCKIFFLDVQKCTSPEEDLQMLRHFHILLGDTLCGPLTPTGNSLSYLKQPFSNSDSISNRILDLQQTIRKKLNSEEFKNCLLVLQNVQNVKTWKAFNLGCKILLITRNKNVKQSISEKMCERIQIEPDLTLSEFYELFEKYLNMKRDKFPEVALDIYNHSNRHPTILGIIARSIRDHNLGWEEWNKNLQESKIKDDKLTPVIEKSLTVLHPDLLDLYATFAIFPHSIPIPVKLLGALWNKSHEVDRIVSKFHEYSFVNKVRDENDEKYCILPFIYASHFKNSETIRRKIKNIKELHNKVIDYYEIDKAFSERSGQNLFSDQHQYFFLCIGYHLKAAERFDLFGKLFLDFGFLQQKLRSVGLLHVLSNLKYYENEITNNDYRRKAVLKAICDFLPKVEEKLMHSKDTCLLQYALKASGEVYNEAEAQVKQFKDNVWFTERGNFHQRRQIAHLENPPKKVRTLENDSCLIILDNDEMILTDISTDSGNSQIHFQNETKYSIIEMVLIRKNDYILTLDIKGHLKLWTIKDDRRRHSLVHVGSKKQKVNPLRFNQNTKHTHRKCKQSIHATREAQRGKIVAFYVEQLPGRHKFDTYLHIAFDTGEICVYKWNNENEEFQFEKVPILMTNFKKIVIICKILTNYYLLMNDHNHLTLWNLRDSSQCAIPFKWRETTSSYVSYELCFIRGRQCIIFVFGNEVRLLELIHETVSIIDGKISYIYETNEAQIAIKCARISPDGLYLLLGTVSGLVVIDMETHSEILRSNVSDAITCVDIYPIDDDVYKYCIVCGVKRKSLLYLFSLLQTGNGSISWSHSVSNLSNVESKDPQLDPGVWLLGGKLYDIVYGNSVDLLAVDSKRRIHKVCTTNDKNWDIINPPENHSKITAITTFQNSSFIGYENGAIFDLNNESFEYLFKSPITLLQLINENILVASSETETCLRNFALETEESSIKLEVDTQFCFKLFDHYLILVSKEGFVTVKSLKNFEHILILNGFENHSPLILGGADLKNSHLFLTTEHFMVILYRFFVVNNELKYSFAKIEHNEDENSCQSQEISCLKASNDGSILAIGSDKGNIGVYKLSDKNTLEKIYCLQSHSSRIYDMKFSPNAEVLISCAEQLCFWSIDYMLNNPLKTDTRKRHSSRFKSQTSYEEVDAKVISKGLNGNYYYNESTAAQKCRLAWENKKGPADKPELLACLKFDGNQAEQIFANDDFTLFNTIDDEGVYYHLELLDISKKIDLEENDFENGNFEMENPPIITLNDSQTIHNVANQNSFTSNGNYHSMVDSFESCSMDIAPCKVKESVDIIERAQRETA